MADVEKIFVNIITYTRLMAYMHNDKVKGEIMLEGNPTIGIPRFLFLPYL